MDATTEARLIDIETRYTHLVRQFDELSAVVAEQQTRIDGLVKSLAAAHARIAELGTPHSNERPPHY
jgi:uncharacterized coiled-coil protein SlyX